MPLIERILAPENLRKAYTKVVQNQGSPGVDGAGVKDLAQQLTRHWTETEAEIIRGTYIPSAILGKEIDKPGGGKRLLGIPTVMDRLIQQSIQQVLSRLYDPDFSTDSYGFRPGKNAHQAVHRALSYIDNGYRDVIDIDLKDFFDRVNHDHLMGLLSRRIHCPATLKLIRSYLKSGIMLNGVISGRKEGTPQGSPLSPVLSNIVLNELDRELESRGHRFVRYADDCSVFVKSKRAALRVKRSLTRYIEQRLKLRVNQSKTKIVRPKNLTLLGFSFYQLKDKSGRWGICVAKKSYKRLKMRLKSITRKTLPWSMDERLRKLAEYTKGWTGYFRIANSKTILKRIDEWVRNRLRYCIWSTWKRIRTRIRNLVKLGVWVKRAINWAYTHRGGWYVAQSPIMNTTVTNDRLKRRGYVSLLETYNRLNHVQ